MRVALKKPAAIAPTANRHFDAAHIRVADTLSLFFAASDNAPRCAFYDAPVDAQPYSTIIIGVRWLREPLCHAIRC